MRYGNSIHHLIKALKVGITIGTLGYSAAALMFIFVEKLPIDRLLPLSFIIILPPIIMGIAVLPTILFSIYITENWVEHRFLERHILSRAKLSEFDVMYSPSGMFAAKLHFSDGSRIRFYGAHLGIISQLKRDLSQSKKEKSQLGNAQNTKMPNKAMHRTTTRVTPDA